MKRHIKFPSIEQFRTAVQNVQRAAAYLGQDENNEPIYSRAPDYPVILAQATEKIHGCFEKNTMVTLANGEEVPISKLQPGTYILTHNCYTGINEYKKVKRVINQSLDKTWCKLVFDEVEIICTKDHLFWTENRGYVEAQHLTGEDIFKTL